MVALHVWSQYVTLYQRGLFHHPQPKRTMWEITVFLTFRLWMPPQISLGAVAYLFGEILNEAKLDIYSG